MKAKALFETPCPRGVDRNRIGSETLNMKVSPAPVMSTGPPAKIKIRFRDLQAMGIVGSRSQLSKLIKAGKFPRPNKDGDSMQSDAWWWGSTIAHHLEQERAAQSAA